MRGCTGIVTPSSSEYRDPNTIYVSSEWFDFDHAPGHEEADINPAPSEIAHAKELVGAWLPEIQDTGEVLSQI